MNQESAITVQLLKFNFQVTIHLFINFIFIGISFYLSEITLALEHLHKQGIVYR